MTAGELARLALDSGADRFGICSAEPFSEVGAIIGERVESGMHGGLGFTFSRPEVAVDIRRTFGWAERLVVLGRGYLPEAGEPTQDGRRTRAVVARFAVEDFYAPLRRALGVVAGRLTADGFRAEVVVDQPFLVDRAAAVRAGLGWWGKNTMVLAPGQGPWMLLGSVVTDARLEVSSPMSRDCGACSACLPACPTGALVAPGVLDTRRCLSAVLQRPGIIPRELRPSVGDRLYGCDDCLDACPPGDRLRRRAAGERGMVEVEWLLTATDTELAERFSHFYLAKNRISTLRRNALVVAANLGLTDLLPHLVGFVGHPDPILRAHAVWAVGRLRPDWVVRLAEDVGEIDRRVVEEYRAFLDLPA